MQWEISTACNSTTDIVDISFIEIGDYYAGGVVFYIDGTGHGLVCAVYDQTGTWGCHGTEIPGAEGIAIGTGSQNTIDIEAGCTTVGTAADICANLTLNSYNDWFLPSKDELNVIYQNKTIINTTATNNGGSNFASINYWTSSEWSTSMSLVQNFSDGFQGGATKAASLPVRAVRAF